MEAHPTQSEYHDVSQRILSLNWSSSDPHEYVDLSAPDGEFLTFKINFAKRTWRRI